MQVYKKDDYRVPVFSWCSDVDEGTQEQIDHLAQLPFVVSHIALMADGHLGYGMPIGGVIACENAIISNAAGKDLGCGMLAVKTNWVAPPVHLIKQIMGSIRSLVPVGFTWHKTPAYTLNTQPIATPIISKHLKDARLQLGTLGGGNHFIEIQRDEQGHVWFMIHSGSRNLGKQVADHYDKIAKELNAKWYSSVPAKWDLAFFPRDDPNFSLYFEEMKYCVNFAQQNRDAMSIAVQEAFLEAVPEVQFEPAINIAHNYIQWDNVNGKNVLIHRKGATSAKKGEIGIIPGSQGSASYIVEGLGNEKSFFSCSHGAGRKMGRNQAKKNLDLATEIKRLDDLGVIHGIRHESDLDEASGAYKDIEEVMENQKDLVKIVTKLTPLAVVKG
jgi:tRNA-splicing ligase RtcB (3'-phosphate/5'-hydroxy nucleic acid ligase)